MSCLYYVLIKKCSNSEGQGQNTVWFSLQKSRVYLTIIPQARMGSEAIAIKAEGRMGHWLRGCKGEKNNCVSTVTPLLSGHLRDFPKCPLNRGFPFHRVGKNCAMFVIKFQRTFRWTLMTDDDHMAGYQSHLQFIDSLIFWFILINWLQFVRVCKFYWWVESLWLLLHKFWSHFGIFGVKYQNEKRHF